MEVIWSDSFDAAAQNIDGYNMWVGSYVPPVMLDGVGNVITPHAFLHDVAHPSVASTQDYAVQLTADPNGATDFSVGVEMRGGIAADGIRCYVVTDGTMLFADSSGIIDFATGLVVSSPFSVKVECIGDECNGYFNEELTCSAITTAGDDGDHFKILLNNTPGDVVRYQLVQVLAETGAPEVPTNKFFQFL